MTKVQEETAKKVAQQVPKEVFPTLLAYAQGYAAGKAESEGANGKKEEP